MYDLPLVLRSFDGTVLVYEFLKLVSGELVRHVKKKRFSVFSQSRSHYVYHSDVSFESYLSVKVSLDFQWFR